MKEDKESKLPMSSLGVGLFTRKLATKAAILSMIRFSNVIRTASTSCRNGTFKNDLQTKNILGSNSLLFEELSLLSSIQD